jgi:hypothetical protein
VQEELKCLVEKDEVKEEEAKHRLVNVAEVKLSLHEEEVHPDAKDQKEGWHQFDVS